MDATAIDDHNDLFVGFAKDVHDLMHILAQGVCVKMRHDLIEDFGCAILDRTNDAEKDATGDAAERVILASRLKFERLVAFDLPLSQGAGGEDCTMCMSEHTGRLMGEDVVVVIRLLGRV